MIAVEQTSIVGAKAESGAFHMLRVKALFQCRPGQSIALIERIAELELANDVVAQTAGAKVGHADGTPIDTVVEGIDKIVARPLVDYKHGFACRGSSFLFIGEFAFLDLDAILPPEPFESFGVGHLFVLHHEVDHISPSSTAETLAELLGRRDHERGRLLIVKRTKSFEVRSRTTKGHKVTHHIDNVGCGHDAVNGTTIYHDETYRIWKSKDTPF